MNQEINREELLELRNDIAELRNEFSKLEKALDRVANSTIVHRNDTQELKEEYRKVLGQIGKIESAMMDLNDNVDEIAKLRNRLQKMWELVEG